jgi:Ni/Co efflux regulator RcnB
MRKTITALFVTVALTGSSGALADGWHGWHGNNNGGGNGGQNASVQGGGGQGGSQSHWGGGDGQHGRWNNGGGSNGQTQFNTQSQNNGFERHSHWGGQNPSNFQNGANVQVQQSWQGGNGSHSHGGNFAARQWAGNVVGWNGNDGGSSRHYRQDQNGSWRDHGNDDNWRKGNGNWNNGGNWNGGGNWNKGHNWNNGGNWNGGHRRDDWRSWRNSNRDLFHLRRYEGPRGYSYRRFYRGYTLDPFFYDQQYWIDDPYQYRLPEAYGPYRWVRYYNDALLVNIYTGEVEDVINDFFW